MEVDNIKFHHACLRLGCSSLNDDLHRRNIVPSPHCACDAVETVSHYFTEYTRYQVMRDRYIHGLPCAPKLENLLFGNDRNTPDTNTSVFLKVKGYIAATKRFDA